MRNSGNHVTQPLKVMRLRSVEVLGSIGHKNSTFITIASMPISKAKHKISAKVVLPVAFINCRLLCVRHRQKGVKYQFSLLNSTQLLIRCVQNFGLGGFCVEETNNINWTYGEFVQRIYKLVRASYFIHVNFNLIFA